MAGSECVFCRIVAGELPCYRIFEDDVSIAFLDIGPLAEGHLLVVPKKHYEQITEMPADEVAALARNLPLLARAVVRATGAEGFNILQNNGRCSGQVVMHVHFHIIPRREGDGLGYRWPAKRYPEGRAEQIQRQIVDALRAST